MNYKIHITQTAERDIEEASDYIDFTLMNPAATDAMLDEIEEKGICSFCDACKICSGQRPGTSDLENSSDSD